MPMSEQVESFAQVLIAAQCGDEWAVSRLWRWYQPRLLRYLRGVCGQAADDVASETWLSVGDGLGKFKGDEEAFRSWLFTLAHRRSIDHHRRAARAPIPTETVPEGSSTDPVELEREHGEALRAALHLLGTLSADQREVVLLRVVAGLEPDRVGAIMGKRPGTVRVLHHRALLQLAQTLKDRGVTPEGGESISHHEEDVAA
jgi:RNA polymerase sigma-70 factor (ECF subfamily)